MNLLQPLIYFVLFAAGMVVVGMFVAWVDRKVTARVQYRVGPPLLQPLWDVLKLMGKEPIVPRGASKVAFFGAPLIGLASVLVVGVMVSVALFLNQGFYGDLIVAVYLLMLPSLAVILGGIASRNPLASVGASREMKLVLAYELPFLLVLAVPVILSGGELRLAGFEAGRAVGLLAYQQAHGSFAASGAGVVALIVAILCVQAKLGLVPFDQAEAETEIMGGALIEYSGPALGIYKLTRILMLYTVPMFVVAVFWGGFGIVRELNEATGRTQWLVSASGVILGAVKYLVLIVIGTLIRNTNPRLRIEHAVKFFWGVVTLLAVAAVVLAVGLPASSTG